MYETINSPINYGGLELKNRIIFAPTTFGLAEDEYFEKIRKIAAGGCAMVIIGDVPVGKSQFEKSLFDKKGFAHYQKLVEIVHSYDCRICAQLHQSDSNMLAMLKYVPGVLTKKISMEELRPLLNAEVAPYISKLSTRKIHKIINGFGEAAVLAVKAGFDMVQVHGDRMCGSFSSTVFIQAVSTHSPTGFPAFRQYIFISSSMFLGTLRVDVCIFAFSCISMIYVQKYKEYIYQYTLSTKNILLLCYVCIYKTTTEAG